MTEESPRLVVLRIHKETDEAVHPLEVMHASRLQCKRGCADCCVDDITVFEVEADRIRQHCGDVLASEPHAPGACAFLDHEGACRIYAHRPYVCRTQGLPLRWIDEDAQAEYRDICPLNTQGPPVEELSPQQCWTLGETEGRLAQLQLEVSGGLDRVSLRSLFQSGNA